MYLGPGKGQVLWTEKMSQDPSITPFLYARDVSTPQPTFYSGIITAYLCMIFVCIKLPQNPPLYIS